MIITLLQWLTIVAVSTFLLYLVVSHSAIFLVEAKRGRAVSIDFLTFAVPGFLVFVLIVLVNLFGWVGA